jgi:peptide deformylase
MGEKLKILTYPHPVLSQVAKPLEQGKFNPELKALIENMFHTMYQAPGIGLAAPQVGHSVRLFVLDIGYSRDNMSPEDEEPRYVLDNFEPMVFINPKITHKEGTTTYQEGCLSLPGLYEDITRAEKISVEFLDGEGKSQTLEADGLLSICIQHENDHLDGLVMLDRLSSFKKNFLRNQLSKKKAKKVANSHE